MQTGGGPTATPPSTKPSDASGEKAKFSLTKIYEGDVQAAHEPEGKVIAPVFSLDGVGIFAKDEEQSSVIEVDLSADVQALTERERESLSEEFKEVLKAKASATEQQSDKATKHPSVSSFISERLAPAHIGRARKKVLTSYRFGIAGAVLATVFAGAVGPLHWAEACSFVRSDECAVRYLPVLFKCDVSIRSYFPRAGVSVHAAEAEQDTSIGGFVATFPTVIFSYAFVGISLFLFATL